MDTIIYLEIEQQQNRVNTGNPFPLFRLREVRGEPHLIYVQLSGEGSKVIQKEVSPKQIDRILRQLILWLSPYLKYSSSVDTIIDASMQKYLAEYDLVKQWESFWPFSVYREFNRKEYAVHLMKQAMQSILQNDGDNQEKEGSRILKQKRHHSVVHMYVLGYDLFVPEVIKPYIPCIRSLSFIECKMNQYMSQNEELEEYLEWLYQEEGIAAAVKYLPEKQCYSTLRLSCELPAIVLDLSGEEKVTSVGHGRNICWIDMNASEEKKRRLEARNSGIMYYSMKEEWKKGRFADFFKEAVPILLDTINKNGYNT